MDLQLKSVFTGDVSVLPFSCEMDFSSLNFQGSLPFKKPVVVTGEVISRAGVITLKADIRHCFEAPCDRCLASICRNETLHCEHVLVTSLNQEETADADELVLVQDFRLNLDELMQSDLYLNLPTKNLCKPDCRGICPNCGKNLNEGECDCKVDPVDPRLAALKDLLK